MTRILRLLVAAVCVAVVHGAAPVLPARAGGADMEVKIDNFTFAPTRITAKVGTTITWVNEDDIPHTIASATKAFKSKALDTDDKFAFTFTTPGTYDYFCSLHPHMTGTVVIEADTGADSPPAPGAPLEHAP
jgi:plastocyanin